MSSGGAAKTSGASCQAVIVRERIKENRKERVEGILYLQLMNQQYNGLFI